MAERAEPELTRRAQGKWLGRLEREHDNLRAALEWSVARGEAEAGLRSGGALRQYWWVRGYLGEGRERLAALLALAGATPRTAARAKALNGAGLLAWQQGDYGAARALQEESLAIFRELDSRGGIAGNLEGLTAVAVAQAQSERAARLFGTAEGLREATGAPLLPADRAEHDRSVAAARAALGEAAFAAAWAAGRALSLEQAVAYALEEQAASPSAALVVKAAGPAGSTTS